MCPHLRVPGTRTGIVPTPMRGLSPCCSSQIVVGTLTRPARSPADLLGIWNLGVHRLRGAGPGDLRFRHGDRGIRGQIASTARIATAFAEVRLTVEPAARRIPDPLRYLV